MISLKKRIRLRELQLNAKRAAIYKETYEIKQKIDKKLATPEALLIAGATGFCVGYATFTNKPHPSESLTKQAINIISLGMMGLSFYEKFKDVGNSGIASQEHSDNSPLLSEI